MQPTPNETFRKVVYCADETLTKTSEEIFPQLPLTITSAMPLIMPKTKARPDAKTIVILCEYGSSKKLGMVTRPTKIAEVLSEDHKVIVVSSTYSHTRSRQPDYSYLKEERVEHRIIGGIFLRKLLPMAPKPLRSLVFSIGAMIYLLANKQNIDILINSIPSHPQIATGILMRFAKPSMVYITDLRDIWSANLRDKAESSECVIRAFLKLGSFLLYKTEQLSFKMATINSSVFNEDTISRYYGVSRLKCIRIPNGFSQSSILVDGGLRTMRAIHERWKAERVGSKAIRKLVYSGSTSKSIDLKIFINAFLSEVDENKLNAQLYILTPNNGSFYRDISKHIIVIENLSHHEILDCYQEMDIGVAKTNASGFFRYGVSLTKYAEYMMCGLPVLDLVNCEETPVTHSRCGVHAEPISEVVIRDAIRQMVEYSPVELSNLGEKGRDWAVEHLEITRSTNLLIHGALQQAVRPRIDCPHKR